MSRLALALAVLVLSLSGCVAYGGDYGYSRPGYSVQYYESYPVYRYYYDDYDRHRYRWHRDRYQERRHSHYAPGYDGRYQWHDERRRDHRHERDRPRLQGYQPPRQGWDQRHREQSYWQRHGGQRYDGYPRRDQRHERQRDREPKIQGSAEWNRRDSGWRWGISD
ncbi:hypothetical protein AAFN46_02515 [Pseudomonas sp. CAU 1711]|uniref:hypothetical protein n=1 Tax=Pseudomonas sp. CAU 1711 TaxID=3140356 RepID=UPI00326096F6